MIVIVAFIVGAALGARTAQRKGGSRLDIAQYSAIFGILFAVAGVFATIAIGRMM